MGLVFKMMIPLVMIALIYGYMLGGHKVVDFMSNLPENAKGVEGVGNAVTDEDVTIYQWTDEKGVKHFSNTLPDGQTADELKMSANTNVIQSIDASKQNKAKDEGGGQVNSVRKSPYSPGGAKEMIDQTKNLKKSLEQKMKDQTNMLDQISGSKK